MDHGDHVQPDHMHHVMDTSTQPSPMAAVSHDHHTNIGYQSHDHSGHGGHGDGPISHMMSMAFHFGTSETVLFDSWTFHNAGGLIGSMIGIFFMAALYEGLKYYREYLFWKTYNALQYRAVSLPTEKGVVNDDNQVVHMVGEVIHKQPPTMLSVSHCFQTLLHILQITLSYFLMLIFMTYNVWLCIAVVIGGAVGYFLFGWKKSIIVNVTEHCH